MLIPGPTKPVADRAAHSAVLPSRNARSTAERHELPENISVGQRRRERHRRRRDLRRVRHEPGHDAPEILHRRDERDEIRTAALDLRKELRQVGRQLRDVARANAQERLVLGDGGIVETDRFEVASKCIGIGDRGLRTGRPPAGEIERSAPSRGTIKSVIEHLTRSPTS